MDLSGIEALGNDVLEVDGAENDEVVNVNTPEVDTLYCDTGLPSKLKGNGTVWTGE